MLRPSKNEERERGDPGRREQGQEDRGYVELKGGHVGGLRCFSGECTPRVQKVSSGNVRLVHNYLYVVRCGENPNMGRGWGPARSVTTGRADLGKACQRAQTVAKEIGQFVHRRNVLRCSPAFWPTEPPSKQRRRVRT